MISIYAAKIRFGGYLTGQYHIKYMIYKDFVWIG